MLRPIKKLFLLISIIKLLDSDRVSAIENVMKIKIPTKSNGDNEGNDDLTENLIDDQEQESHIPYDLQIVAQAFYKLEDSQCVLDGKEIVKAITRRERWALKLFDASSKFPVGILQGAFYQFGNFDECVQTTNQELNRNSASSLIQGQYCLSDIELPRNSADHQRKSRNEFNGTIHWGICVPSSCTPSQVEMLVKEIFTVAMDHDRISVHVNPDRCYIQKSVALGSLEIIYASLIGLFLLFIIFATIFHYHAITQRKSNGYNLDTQNQCSPSTARQILYSFSLIKTIGTFLKTKSSDRKLESICGIKVLSMILIIGGHTLLFTVGGPVLNTQFYEQQTLSLSNGVYSNSPLLVDTFLLLSGFLISYLFLIELDKRKGRINFMILYVARYIRLTPSYLVIIGFYCTFLIHIGSGPLWNSRVSIEQERCLKSWWTNLLYINNYVNTDSMCMFQSWYLAVDYHLFIIAPFIIYLLWKNGNFGKFLLGLLIIVSIVIPFGITLRAKLDPTLMIYAPEVFDISQNSYFRDVYIKTHMRFSSYCLGLLFGYIVYKYQDKNLKLSTLTFWLGWLISALCGIFSLFSIVVFYDPNYQYNALEAAIYAAFHRVGWCISIGWILLVCVTNNSVLVNKFLSWKLFIPLSRITYCAYLVNGIVEIYSLGTIRTAIHMDKFEMAVRIIAHVILTASLAFIICILFESPIHGLEKILLQREKAKTKYNTSEVAENDSS